MIFIIKTYFIGKYRSFHHSNNCFVVLMFCNRLIGFWDNPGTDPDRFHPVKRILINFSFMYATLEVISVTMAIRTTGFNENVGSLFLVIARQFCLAIWCSLAFNRQGLKEIWIYLLSVQQDAVDDSRHKYIRFVNWFTLMFLILNLLPLMVWVINGQIGSPLAVFGSPWLDRLNTVLYPAAVFLITLMLCYAIIMTLSIMSAFTLEFRLLGMDFQQIFEEVEPHGEIIVQRWINLEKSFGRCVERHQTLLSLTDSFRQLLKTNFLIQLVVNFCLIVLHFSVYVLMQRHEVSGFAFSAFAVIALMMNMLLYGFLCDQLEEQVLSINHQLYCSGWTDKMIYSKAFARRYKNLRQTMLIVMERTQKKVGFTCGNFFEMSLVTCRKVLSFTYTVVAVLTSVLE
ncbi:uncharacterized protein LOC109412278 [Aedes albopictus]|uniref:Odorant receptor n=1 Tax=Aedes albopictus TaxID=7160 RepID=A0ABM2A028_AEDAL